jgi:hypothetical protein
LVSFATSTTARAAAAPTWIVSTLNQHQVSYQVVGDLAALAFGGTRPLHDSASVLHPRFFDAQQHRWVDQRVDYDRLISKTSRNSAGRRAQTCRRGVTALINSAL